MSGIGDVDDGRVGPRALVDNRRTGHGGKGLLLRGGGAETFLEPRQAHTKEDEEEGDEGAEGHTEGADADGRHGEEGKRVLCRGREGKGRGERGVECSCSTAVSRMAPVAWYGHRGGAACVGVAVLVGC